MQFGPGRQSTSAHETFSLCSLTTRYLAVLPSRSSLAMLLSLMLLAGLAGCGPASSDNAPSLGPNASVGRTTLSKQSPLPGNNPLTPVSQAVSPVALASVNGTGSASGVGTVPGGDKLPVPSIPDSIAKDLVSSDARTRYRALDHWEAKDTKAPLDPVFEAMEDEDEAVRAKATAIVEKHWAAEKEREKG
jgi:hypothetical protein